MKRAALVLALVLVAVSAFSQDVTMTGTWQLYRVDTIGSFSLNEYQTSVPTSSFVDATLVLEADGTMTSDSQSLRFIGWSMRDQFLVFQTPSGNSFYKIRDLSPDALLLVSVIVTEQNDVVTQIEANENANLFVVRTQN